MKNIAIFYHCLFVLGAPPQPLVTAPSIIAAQMALLSTSGLLDAASEMHVGVNGGAESEQQVSAQIPAKAQVVYHGLQSRCENLTLVMLEKWLPIHDDWYVLYFHSKGATHPPGHDMSTRWRDCMMRNAVANWRTCVADLDAGYEAVGSHWMTGAQTPPGQSIFAGNFWWSKSSFLKTLPSIYERDRIKVSGISALESRYESEVWIGNGPRLPKIKDYHGPGWNPGQIGTCIP
jgi:hypothetical protein